MIDKYTFQEKIRNAYPDNLSELVPSKNDELHQIGLSDEETKNQIIYGWRGFEERKWLAKILDLHDGQKILEIGSCWGDESIFLGENINGTIYALDPIMPRQKVLGQVLKHYQFEDKSEIVPITGDMFNLSFKNDALDRILAVDTVGVASESRAADIMKMKPLPGKRLSIDEALEYVFDGNHFMTYLSCIEEALENMQYALKKGGKAILTGEILDIQKPVFKSIAYDTGFKKCTYIKDRLYHDTFNDYGYPSGRKRSTFRAISLEK